MPTDACLVLLALGSAHGLTVAPLRPAVTPPTVQMGLFGMSRETFGFPPKKEKAKPAPAKVAAPKKSGEFEEIPALTFLFGPPKSVREADAKKQMAVTVAKAAKKVAAAEEAKAAAEAAEAAAKAAEEAAKVSVQETKKAKKATKRLRPRRRSWRRKRRRRPPQQRSGARRRRPPPQRRRRA